MSMSPGIRASVHGRKRRDLFSLDLLMMFLWFKNQKQLMRFMQSMELTETTLLTDPKRFRESIDVMYPK